MLPEKVKAHLAKGQWGRVSIPVSGDFPETVDALIFLDAYPFIEAEFHSVEIPRERIEAGREWLVIVTYGLDLISLHVRPVSLPNPDRYRLRIIRSQCHSHTRRSLRVNTEVYIRFCKEGEEDFPPDPPSRKKVDISRSGVRFVDPSHFLLNDLFSLEIHLPGSVLHKLVCVGKVVRVDKREGDVHEVGFQFVSIDPADGEKIDTFCMGCQFRQMADRVMDLAGGHPALPEDDDPARAG